MCPNRFPKPGAAGSNPAEGALWRTRSDFVVRLLGDQLVSGHGGGGFLPGGWCWSLAEGRVSVGVEVAEKVRILPRAPMQWFVGGRPLHRRHRTSAVSHATTE